MEFGIILPQGWLNSIRQFNDIARIAEHAERLKFNSLYAYDHLLPYSKYSSIEDPILECWTLISSLVGVTKDIKLGTVVLCNSYRNPALLAKMGATLAYLSNGRLEFGIGAGWYEEEYHRFGYEFPDAKVRVEQLDEALYIIKGLWKHGRFRFDGKYYKIDAICNPKPNNIKIMVGGSGNKLLKVAAKHADIYNHPFGSADEVKEKASIVKRYNKDIKISILLRAIIGKEEQVNRIINKIKDGNESVDDYIARVKDYTLFNDNAKDLLNSYIDSGVSHFIIHLFGLEDDLTLLDMLRGIIDDL